MNSDQIAAAAAAPASSGSVTFLMILVIVAIGVGIYWMIRHPQERAALEKSIKDHIDEIMRRQTAAPPAAPTIPVVVTQPQPPAAPPAPPTPAILPAPDPALVDPAPQPTAPAAAAFPADFYIDRDDLVAAATSSAMAVMLDGAQIKGGFGPALSYISGEGTPNKNIRRAGTPPPAQ